jgi:cytochrome c oxidase cbb3-type subunit I
VLPVASLLLVVTFLVSISGLFVLIWSLSTGQFSMGPDAPRVIFGSDEVGNPEDPAGTAAQKNGFEAQLNTAAREPNAGKGASEDDLLGRFEIDQAARRPVLLLVGSSIVWLVLGSMLGVMVSLKFQFPDWLTQQRPLTFGVLRPLHLNTVIYGWVSMAGMGVSLWLTTRILKTPLRGAPWAMVGGVLWNLGVVLGSIALFVGWTDGVEWLEYPWPVDALLVMGGACIGVPILRTIQQRKVHHLYVSIWYIGAAFVWFPLLFLIANLPGAYTGVQHAIVNWWYAHNVLGLWLTPFGLAAAYYFIPKILGKPIHSYQLSLLGFWSLALFYSQVGVHHLIGGPVPTWLVTLSIVTSVMMVVPVGAVAVNHHRTMLGHFRALRFSPTLAFIVSGSMMYTAVSVQGSLQALRVVNTVTHFTHATVAHAHLGVYGFVSFILFGSLYFILPRLSLREWPYPRLIPVHYWLSLSGILIYFAFLTIGGLLQGTRMLDASLPFMDSVNATKPYLLARTVGGSLMALGHLVFGFHVVALLSKRGPELGGARLFYDPSLRPAKAHS